MITEFTEIVKLTSILTGIVLTILFFSFLLFSDND